MNEDYTRILTSHLAEFDVDVFGIGQLSAYSGNFMGLGDDVATRFPFAVCFGLLLSKGVLSTVQDGPNPLYLHHYRQLNYRLDIIAYRLSMWIEKMGFMSIPCAASQVVDWRNQKAHLSHKHIAVIAGLGWIGRNNLLVHPEFGSCVRYNTVLTSMPLHASEPLNRDCGECRACIDVCPGGAIKPNPSEFDHMKCYETITHLKNKRNLGHHICGICVEACGGAR